MSSHDGLSNQASPRVPNRAEGSVLLNIKDSGIPGAGRGVFIGQDVKAGDLVFTIKRPLLNIVRDDDSSRRGLFAITICQSKAWRHHHKYECSILKMKSNDPSIPFENSVLVRQMLRLIVLRDRRRISGDEWNEFLAMKQGDSARFANAVELATSIVARCETELSPDTVSRLIYAVSYNQLKIVLPVMKPKTTVIKMKGEIFTEESAESTASLTVAGEVLDPFVSLLNHACSPNVSCIFKGYSLHIQAEKDIKAGEELFVSYTCNISMDELGSRQIYLLKKYDFNCECTLCRCESQGPPGELGEKVLALINIRPNTMKPSHAKDFEAAIQEMFSAGFGYSSLFMYLLHRQLLRINNFREVIPETIKTVLTLHCVILPTTEYPLVTVDRLDNLEDLIEALLRGEDFLASQFQCDIIFMQAFRALFGKKLASCMVQCFGKDSAVWITHSDELDVTIDEFLNENGEEEMKKLVGEKLDTMLEWAGFKHVVFEESW